MRNFVDIKKVLSAESTLSGPPLQQAYLLNSNLKDNNELAHVFRGFNSRERSDASWMDLSKTPDIFECRLHLNGLQNA